LYIDFVDRTGITEKLLDDQSLANLYAIHEIKDGFGTGTENFYTLTKAYATYPEDTEVEAGTFSALHWSAKAEAQAVIAAAEAATATAQSVIATDEAAQAADRADNALISKTEAGASAAAALVSEGNALISENAAAASELAAADSETAAGISEVNAAASAADALASELAAADSEAAAGVSETNAAASASAALASEINAADSETTVLAAVGNVAGANDFINGGFDVDQWQISVNVQNAYFIDRWYSESLGVAVDHSRMEFTPGQTEVAGNPRYYMSMSTSGSFSSDYHVMSQALEDARRLAGTVRTVSFDVLGSVSGNVSIEGVQYFGTGGSPTVNTISVTKLPITTEWTRVSAQIVFPSVLGKTIGDGSYSRVYFWLSAGSTYDSRTDSLGHQDMTISFANIKMEAGTVATPFVAKPLDQELRACMRYVQFTSRYSTHGHWAAYTTIFAMHLAFAVDMRAPPILSKNSAVSSVGALVQTGIGPRDYVSASSVSTERSILLAITTSAATLGASGEIADRLFILNAELF
jgi:hypothetical protein